jgi:ArsR family transcriptional regulator
MPHDAVLRPLSTAAFASAFKALGDLNRLRAFAIIAARGAICVGDLVTVLDLPQSTVSRHLGVLRNAGLVRADRVGTWVHYALSEEPSQGAFTEHLARLVASSEAFAEDLSRAASLAAAGGCCPQHPRTMDDAS